MSQDERHVVFSPQAVVYDLIRQVKRRMPCTESCSNLKRDRVLYITIKYWSLFITNPVIGMINWKEIDLNE